MYGVASPAASSTRVPDPSLNMGIHFMHGCIRSMLGRVVLWGARPPRRGLRDEAEHAPAGLHVRRLAAL